MAMEWKDVLGKIGQIAPAVGAAWGAPGVAIGAVVSAIINAFGLKPDAKPEDIMKAIEADPQAALKLLMAKQDYELKQSDNRLKELEMMLKDTQDARKMKVEETKATGKRDIEDKVFDWVIIIGFAYVFGALVYYKPAESTYLGMMIGAVIAAFTTIVNFRRGTSQSSKDKTELLAKAEPIK